MKNRILFIGICIFFPCFVASAQVRVGGVVSDISTKEKLSFVNVYLQVASDSTKNISGTMTDLQGRYSLDNVPEGTYRLIVACIGYLPIKEDLVISAKDSGKAIEKNFSLHASATELKETVVVGKRTNQHIDHRSITFTNEQIKAAQVGRDLLKTLPEIREDIISGKLVCVDGSSLLILINGVHSSEADLRALSPGRIKYIEYYDIPPARYASVGTVVNIVTKSIENGYSFGFHTMDAFTTGFSNSQAYFSLTRGKSKFDFSYDFNLRNYKHCKNTQTYEYIKSGKPFLDTASGDEKFGYISQGISLKYAYINNDKSLFQIAFQPNLFWNHSKKEQKGIYGTTEISRFSNEDTHVFNPSLDLYFWKKLGKKNEISININSSMFNVHGSSAENEYVTVTGLPNYQDEINLKNRKNSVIGELAYGHNLTFGRLNAGYRVGYSHLKSNIDNIEGHSVSTTNQTNNYLYTELSGGKQLMYRVSLGLTFISNKSQSNSFNHALFTPKVLIGYKLPRNTSLRFELSSTPIVPSLNMLSSNVTRLTKDIVSRGNPELISGQQTTTTLLLNSVHKYLELSAGIAYIYASKPINQYFYLYNNSNIVLGYRNSKYAHTYGGMVSLSIKPFGTNMLSILLRGKPFVETIYSNDGTNKLFSLENTFQVGFNYKKISANYRFSIPVYKADGAFKYSTEATNNLYLSYKYKNWKFSTALLFIGKGARYITKSKETSIVKYERERRITDNRSMFTIGIEYNFNSGKNKSVKRTLNNRDMDSPTF